WPTVLLSLLVAISASAFALYVVSRHELGMVRALAGSVIMGSGIAAMHYIGMAAMRLAAVFRFHPLLVTLSVAFAIAFSFAALILVFDLREETKGTPSRKIASAVVMGAAVSAMHYTGMASASFMPSTVAPGLSHAASVSSLGNAGIVIVTLIVLVTVVLTSAVDRRLASQRAELERGRELATINEELRKPCLRFLQRTFGSFPIFNISGRSVPFNNVPQFVAQRHSALRKPAIFSVRPPHAHVMLKRFPSGHGRAPRVHEPFTVFGMKLFRPSPTQSPLRRDACIFQPALVEEIQGTVR